MPENTLFAFHSGNAAEGPPTPWGPELSAAVITRYWDGRPAVYPPWHNVTAVIALWDDARLAFHFGCCYERLQPDVDDPGRLWEGDVVEFFLRQPDETRYYEVEVSPSGQTLSAAIREPRVDVDFGWRPALHVESRVLAEDKCWMVSVAVSFADLGRQGPPRLGDSWRLNLTRIAGAEPNREYLAWRPTFTATPDFHRPASFGNLIFLGEGPAADAA